MLEGDVIIGAGVLPVGKKEGKVNIFSCHKVPSHHWSGEELAAQFAHDSGRVFMCVLERTYIE